MKKFAFLALASGVALAAAAPASATVILVGSPALPASAFNIATQGALQTFSSTSSQAFTFNATVRSAVYLNTLGTLDFYYQISQIGAGSTGGNDPIQQFTAANFQGYNVDAMVYNAATGSFVAPNNTGEAAGVSRNAAGVITTDLTFGGLNPAAATLTTGDNSLIYVFRTNATNYSRGTVGVSDGSTTSVFAFQPAAAVPEPATWGMMILGFGLMGAAVRRRKTTVAFA